MKYGLLICKPIKNTEDRNHVNLGDAIQTEAILYLYSLMGISKKDIIKIDILDLNSYAGEPIVLPININLSSNWIINIFPLPDNIIPVFLGLSYFTIDRLSDELINYFKRYEPIGCRDEITLEIMRENGIDAYLYGCITAIFPKYRRENSVASKVFLVDVPKSFIDFSKEKLNTENIEISSHIHRSTLFNENNYMEKYIRELLLKYKTEAKLIITSRLHCMSPCMAFGIPVIAVSDNISHRMAWIDKFLTIYTPETYDQINWEGKIIEYENLKEKMISIAIEKIMQTVKKYRDIKDVSYYYESRKKSEYGNLFLSKLKKVIDNTQEFNYIIWGAGQIGMNTWKIIKDNFPKATLKMVVDTYCEGTFQGLPILKPDVLTEEIKEYIFIASTSGEKSAINKMKEIGKIENQDYISLATTAG